MRIFKDTFWNKHQHLISMFAPILAGIILVVLASLNLTSSIWFDEAYSAYLVRGDFGQIWSMTAMDVHPPLYYFCLKLWTLLFGTSDFAMRFMSVFLAAVALVFAFQLIKRWFGVKAATFSTIFMSLSPMLIRYSQEMRMYTLVLVIIMAATYVLTLALDHQKRRYWVIYGFLVSLGMWTQYFSALVWLLHVCYLIYYYGSFKKFWQHKEVILAYLLVIILYLPWLPSFIHQFLDVQGGFWISSPTLATPIDYLAASFVYQEESASTNAWYGLLVIILTILLTTLAVYHYRQNTRSTRLRFILIFGLILFPPLLLLAMSMPPLRAYFVPRYVLYSSVAIWLLAGLLLASAKFRPLFSKIPKLTLAPVLSVLMLTAAVIGVINVTTRTADGYIKDIIIPVQQLSSVGEPVLAATDFIYYDAVFYDSAEHPVYFVDNWTDYRWGSLVPIKAYHYHVIDNLPQFLADQDRFWYIDNYHADAAQHLPASLAEHYRVINEISNDHHIALELERQK